MMSSMGTIFFLFFYKEFGSWTDFKLQQNMSADYYSAPSHAEDILNELGIDNKDVNPTFKPQNQPQFKAPSNKYMDQPESHTNQEPIDFDLPTSISGVSTIQRKKETSPQTEKPKGRKKQSKRDELRKKKTNKNSIPDKKQEVEMNVELDQVAEWGEKGTRVDGKEDDDDFDGDDDEGEEREEITQEQQKIRRNIEQKLKKYENPMKNDKNKGTAGTTSSLQNKVEELKRRKEAQNSTKEKTSKTTDLDETNQNMVINNNQKRMNHNNNEINEKGEEDEASQDHWEKINQQTIANKNEGLEKLSSAAQTDLNKYYEALELPSLDDMEEQEEPSTGFIQKICACLSNKAKPTTQVEKQILRVSKIQLTNKVQEIIMLKGIWTSLTGKKYLRYGEHWSEIGFQGRDPATDLRSTGILSLLHWHNFISFDLEFCIKIFNFCIEFDLPLALTHIKVTSLVCSSIKRRQLSGRNWVDFLEWYYALCYFTFEYLMEKAKNIEQIGQLVEQSIERTKNQLQNAKKHFNVDIKSRR